MPPTVVTQGEPCAAYADRPLLPAAATTTTSASAAPSNARSRVSRLAGPATDRLSTSTPSRRLGRPRSPGQRWHSRRRSGPERSSRPCRPRSALGARHRRTCRAPRRCRGPRRRRCRRRWTRPGCRGRCRRAGRGRSSCGRWRSRSRRRTTVPRRPSGCRSTRSSSSPSSQTPRKARGCAPRPGTPAKSGLSRPQAGVDDADHDTRAAAGAARRGAGGALVRTRRGRRQWADLVGLDQRDRRVGRQDLGLGGGQLDGVPVEGLGPAVDRLAGSHRGERRVLRGPQPGSGRRPGLGPRACR